LLAALKTKELGVVIGAYDFFIRRGDSAAQPVLIEALEKHGAYDIATDYLLCGNPRLAEAALSWLDARDFIVDPSFRTGAQPQWGSRR
jgi:hypothetical protein